MLIKVNIESLVVSHSHMWRGRGVGITRGLLHMRKNIMMASDGCDREWRYSCYFKVTWGLVADKCSKRILNKASTIFSCIEKHYNCMFCLHFAGLDFSDAGGCISQNKYI